MRIKFEIPVEFQVFETKVQVRIDDINYGQHLSNDRLLVYAHEARMRYFRALGIEDEKSVGGSSIIMSDSAIMYRNEGLWAQELNISIYLPPTHSYGFDLFYSVQNDQGAEVARIKTGLVFYDYEKKKLSKAPIGLENVLTPIIASFQE
ncbi:MAG: thioesterase family protein [Bacteriovoracaceae bacterium]